MNSYDGTVLTTFLKQDPSDVPEGQTLYEYAKAQIMEQYGVDMLDQLGINNSRHLVLDGYFHIGFVFHNQFHHLVDQLHFRVDAVVEGDLRAGIPGTASEDTGHQHGREGKGKNFFTMDNEKMTDMTYAVDVEGRTVDEVAREFLVENGLLDLREEIAVILQYLELRLPVEAIGGIHFGHLEVAVFNGGVLQADVHREGFRSGVGG